MPAAGPPGDRQSRSTLLLAYPPGQGAAGSEQRTYRIFALQDLPIEMQLAIIDSRVSGVDSCDAHGAIPARIGTALFLTDGQTA